MFPYTCFTQAILHLVANTNHILNQDAWFLKFDPVQIVGMRVCVSIPEAINN